MRKVVYLVDARKALRKHRPEARRIMAKIEAYALDPDSQANNVKRLKGELRLVRLRVGDYRVLLLENAATVEVVDIGPRGSIYRRGN
ncbi:MAG: type II toxin-antitoxin system RelE/ParE family toxin [Bauldia sp.]